MRKRRYWVIRGLIGITVSALSTDGAQTETGGLLAEQTVNNTYNAGDAGSTTYFGEIIYAVPVQKFDAALGELTSVEISLVLNWNYAGDLLGSGVVDALMGNSVVFDAEPVFFGLYYKTEEASQAMAVLEHPVALAGSALSPAGSTPASEIIGQSGQYAGMVTVDGPPFALESFVGAGLVSRLGIGIFVPSAGSFTLGNLTDAELALSAIIAGGEIGVVYHYTPIPEPRSLSWITGVLTIACLAFKRRRLFL